MKDKKNLSNSEKIGLLKKRENATFIAGAALALTAVLSFPVAMLGSIPFDSKLESAISETGYFEYAEEKKAEYKEQYDNGEIPKGVYDSYVEYYGTTPAVEEYLKSINETEKFDKIDGIVKSRTAYSVSVLGLGLLSAFAGLGCLLAFRGTVQSRKKLEEENAEIWENLSQLPDDSDIFPDLYEKVEEEGEEEK